MGIDAVVGSAQRSDIQGSHVRGMTPKWDSAKSSTREDFRLIDADTSRKYKKMSV